MIWLGDTTVGEICIPRTASRARVQAFEAAGFENVEHLHKTPREYVLGRGRPDFLYAVVRHPVDRAISLFHYFCDGRVIPNEASCPDANVSETWLKYARVFAESDTDGKMGEWFGSSARVGRTPLWHPQARTLSDGPPMLDYVGRFEDLTKTWKVVQMHLGQELPALAVKGVTTNRRDDSVYLENVEATQIIREYYAEDFKAFGYAESFRGSRPSHGRASP